MEFPPQIKVSVRRGGGVWLSGRAARASDQRLRKALFTIATVM